ncbi:YidC/Oxa1 family membrane protein insertase [Helicobacter sp. 23-1048]
MLIDILYYTFIFPLQSVLGFALDLLHSLTHNYGLSIILLSLLVNLFLLKLAKIAESKATKINALKSVCDKKIAEFKRVFKGAELQSYIRTLYRQKHYHPIFALSALGGLALQVPFFIAVLCLLQEFDGIKGVSFLWIADLSLPDLVFGVHLLPILMTIISLVNVWIVAKDKGARIQGALISLIFLVLLYQMPSALVLYWSTNMGFSLIRAIWGKVEAIKNPCHTERSEVSQTKIKNKDISPTAQYNKDLDSSLTASDQNNKWGFFIHHKPFKIAIIALSSILAIGLCLTFALMLYSKNNVQTAELTLKDTGIAKIHFSKWDFLLRSKSIAKIIAVNVEWDKNIDTSNIKVFSVANRYVQFGGIKSVVKKGDYMGQILYKADFTPLLKNIFVYYFTILGTILGVYLLLCAIAKFQTYSKSNALIYRAISIYATLCIAFLICVFAPYQLYSTDITQFDSSQTIATLSALFGAFLLISFIVIYALSFVPKRFSNIIAFVLSVILFSGIVYSFILVGDYGAMDGFVFKQSFENSQSKTNQIIEFSVVMILGVTIAIFALKKLFYVWQIVLMSLFILSGINIYDIISKRLNVATEIQKHQNNTKSKVPYEDELLSYSKTDKNIVVFMFDAFSGSHTPYILEQFPEFKEQLDGFTLFDNTVSTSSGTVHSISTLIAGEYATAYNMNKRNEVLAKQIKNAFESIALNFVNSGYQVGLVTLINQTGADNKLSNPQFISLDDNFEYITTPYLDYEKENLKESKIPYGINKFLGFGLFKFVPRNIKQKIYRNGLWLSTSNQVNYQSIIGHSSTAYVYTHFGNTNAQKPTFKFLHSLITHTPLGMYFKNNKCHFFDKNTALDENPNIQEKDFLNTLYQNDEGIRKAYYQHYDTEACAIKYLTDYISMLKQMGIYDNTQIFVISDHAGEDSINIPIDSNPDTLFLFKDFGTRGTVKIDNRLMANYDIASIFCENLPNGCPNVPPNILKNYPQNREVIHLKIPFFLLKQNLPHQWIIQKAYKVRGNIYDEKNWTDISDESYGIVNIKE